MPIPVVRADPIDQLPVKNGAIRLSPPATAAAESAYKYDQIRISLTGL
jgi:hypothetical protein